MSDQNELVLFQTVDEQVKLNVAIEGETVWLNQQQMVELFNTTKQNISLHINNCFREGELEPDSVVKDSLTTALDGKMYNVRYYNLDVIISVGYRVKSNRGLEFRRWANTVLKEHILKGYSINGCDGNFGSKSLFEIRTRILPFEAYQKLKLEKNPTSFSRGSVRLSPT